MTRREGSRHIRFIVTGDMERRALVPSMQACFPAVTLEDETVRWSTAPMLSGATTHRLRAEDPPNSTMRSLARALIAELLAGEDGKPADLVAVVDDLELANLDQPAVVGAHFRHAVERDIAARNLAAHDEAALRARLRERGSFHLLCPMVEAYLFGEAAALVRAGCAADVEPLLVSEDFEAFESCDPAWLPECNRENGIQQPSKRWWREERHPKHYLTHLVERAGRRYRETKEGVAALRVLAWTSVARGEASIALMRALFEDIADFFGVPSPLGAGTPTPVTYVGARTHKQRERLLLRNMERDRLPRPAADSEPSRTH